MSKLLVIASNAANAVFALEQYGLKIEDAQVVKRLDDILGYKDMLMLYGREAYMLPDFDKILDYCVSHDIVCIKSNSGHDFVAAEPEQS